MGSQNKTITAMIRVLMEIERGRKNPNKTEINVKDGILIEEIKN